MHVEQALPNFVPVQLAPYACHPVTSRGRRHPELPAPTRSCHQRDRDRIVHSTAFRRLVYKTQVFLNHEGDLFRTRLTHSLEVAQLGRSIARALALNEDLVEAIALAHDLGHTPFGHAGQDALNHCLRERDARSSGFEHNFQSLRVVDTLEERYPDFEGLNLTFETREGILKHCSVARAQQLVLREPNGVGQRFLDHHQPSLEAQLCNLADEIAYNAHDVDDGVRSGLLTLEQLEAVPLFRRFQTQALVQHPHLQGRRLLFESIRLMLSEQVYDVLRATTGALKKHAFSCADDVRLGPAVVRFSAPMQHGSAELKKFLFDNLYRHPHVQDITQRAKRVIADLFAIYQAEPALWAGPGVAPTVRQLADYIAGMTDRFALRAHERLTGQRLIDA
jgi:dGTPase